MRSLLASALPGVLVFTAALADPFPSWNDTASKQAIVDSVEKGAVEGSPDHVPPAERVVVFE